ncbi:MAG TPA: hypothetical protein VF411_05030, partial [Bacteroidia bacterium]
EYKTEESFINRQNYKLLNALAKELVEDIEGKARLEKIIKAVEESERAYELKIKQAEEAKKAHELQMKQAAEEAKRVLELKVKQAAAGSPKVNNLQRKQAYEEIEKAYELKEKQYNEDVEKVKSNKLTNEYFYLEGRVGKNPQITLSDKQKILYYTSTLAESIGTGRDALRWWHNIAMWEGELTKNIGLSDHESIRAYFLKFKTNDLLKLKGYNRGSKYINKEGRESIKITFIITEVVTHIPYVPEKETAQ